MKTLLLTLIIFTNVYLFGQSKTFDNFSVIEMKKANLSKPIIINALNNETNFNFDISTSALKELSNNKIDDEIIVLMMQKQKDKIENIITVDGLQFAKKEYGLFVNQEGQKVKITSHLTELDFAMKFNAQIPNLTADISISSDVKTFYFNFGLDENNSTNSTFNLTNSITDPNEGELVKLSKIRKKRQFRIGKAGLGGIKMEIPSDIRIEYKIEKIKFNLYKITIEKSLQPGEYAFFFGALSPTAMKVYDFNVK